ncbi:uncharacterized protein PG998_008775 [Apiospora kogelbergensis]|uniref:uncharacterized protein n=1 Tax=Apiospora kogelbergensis TaxID=1337665 RepID=UPI00312ECA0D
MSNPENYTIGWVCALTIEFVAARAFFDETHEGPSHVSPNDDNSYALGRVGQHNVVMAVLPDGEYGTAAAATVAKDMLHSFPNVRIGLMVGIGGGAPSGKHDVRLGDVVVSSPCNGHGGVFQYDFGKTIQNQTFQDTGFLNQPPTILRTAVNAIRANYELEGHFLAEDAEAATNKIKKRKKFTRPAPRATDFTGLRWSTLVTLQNLARKRAASGNDSTDDTSPIQANTKRQKLSTGKASTVPSEDGGLPGHHEPTSDLHPGAIITCSDENIETLMVPRKPRTEEDDDPMVHYGLIASANQLMKDATVRDRLAAEKGVLCFEMEAAGLMNTFPCLVIRGICDYSDSHKNKDWQGFAAIMAAAYAKDLLRQISPNKVEAEKRIGDVVGILAKEVHGMRETVEGIRQNDLDNDVNEWLSPPNPSTNLFQARKLRHVGTGTWFLKRPSYQEWLSGQRRHIWVRAFAGSGKTVLTSTILDDLKASTDHVVLSFFFDFSDQKKKTVNGMLRSLAFQLYRQEKGSAENLTEAFKAHRHGQPSSETLSDAIFKMCETHDRILIVLDALDESTERDDLLAWIEKTIHHSKLGRVQLLCTGRPEHGFIGKLPGLFGEKNCLDFNLTAVNADIGAYVKAELQKNPEFTGKKLSEDLRENIIHRLGNGAEGMFRWASCQLGTLAGCVSPMAMERALEDLPRDLDTTYERMIDSIPEELKDGAKRLLQFLVYSERPVNLNEAIDFLATQTDTEPRGFDVKRRVFNKASVLKHCPGLVTTFSRCEIARKFHYIQPACYELARKLDYIQPARYELPRKVHYIQLAHFSVKQYLCCRQDGFKTSQANFVIMRTIDYYLKSVQQPKLCILGFELERYALRHWSRHAALAEGGETDSATTTIVEALHTRANCRHWTRRFAIVHIIYPDFDTHEDYACLGGRKPELEQTVQSLRRMGANANELFWACALGLRRTAQRLLNEGAKAKFQHWFYGNPLTAACWGRSIETVQLLLNSGADVNAQGGFYGSALIAACVGESLPIVQLLLDSGANVNARGGYYSHALIAASFRGHMEVVQLLLDHQADVNARGEMFVDALTAASGRDHLPTMRILLAKGAKVNVSGGPTGDVFRLQLGAHLRSYDDLSCQAWVPVKFTERETSTGLGANPEIRGVTGRTPLSWAAERGRQDGMRILLETGRVDPDARDNNGRTPLSWAAENNHTGAMRMLLETGRVDPDARDNNGRTPLSWASTRKVLWSGNNTLELLLQIGRDDANFKGMSGRSTPLIRE